ncbi:uncharacterized protein LOC133645328 isoform X1 [Entelurus aequoreus]|uniref:uncharacterized protein LOC133645291 n=1 Tax=Entelurus aequoreus TaxID=161455 RepID=UPI002B1D556D|nr:uncharacterized protein LOC133645291 [Entelurus aequoreus]XP_061896197.1 uncharacterized protein LOC133645326 [Entelurus aequoreus]XP_061896198.1 uncharacterized protein LOC133645326 [Entelurus aequoreus]XP_061896199.1 uncharacterized protein LOC133645328 isoform X1 [Entelurus aequoreus]XP_061896200.1 uncharacterized protein LOC133645328 isoform X1 [Entelurus aequoreus]
MLIVGPKSLTKTAHNSTLSPSTHIRNLGVILDNKLSFQHRVNHITRTAFFHLQNIARLRPSFSAAETLIHAFITSTLDYCNGILYDSSCKILKVQYVQNSAARLLSHTRSREHITPVLQKLHWLPSPHRIHFKSSSSPTKPSTSRPPATSPTCFTSIPSRSLRSSDANLLSPPCRTKLRTWGDSFLHRCSHPLEHSSQTHP